MKQIYYLIALAEHFDLNNFQKSVLVHLYIFNILWSTEI